jgi:hypothetical protein
VSFCADGRDAVGRAVVVKRCERGGKDELDREEKPFVAPFLFVHPPRQEVPHASPDTTKGVGRNITIMIGVRRPLLFCGGYSYL